METVNFLHYISWLIYYSRLLNRPHVKAELAQAKIPYSLCSYELPEIETMSIPLRVESQLPAHGYVREPLNATVILRNAGHHSIELDITMDSNDAFMFAGNKQIKIQIYPGDSHKLIYNLYPLLSGYVALPPLRLNCIGSKQMETELNSDVIADLLTRHLPSHIYVLVRSVPLLKKKYNFIHFIFSTASGQDTAIGFHSQSLISDFLDWLWLIVRACRNQ